MRTIESTITFQSRGFEMKVTQGRSMHEMKPNRAFIFLFDTMTVAFLVAAVVAVLLQNVPLLLTALLVALICWSHARGHRKLPDRIRQVEQEADFSLHLAEGTPSIVSALPEARLRTLRQAVSDRLWPQVDAVIGVTLQSEGGARLVFPRGQSIGAGDAKDIREAFQTLWSNGVLEIDAQASNNALQETSDSAPSAESEAHEG